MLTSPECSSFTSDPQFLYLSKFAITHSCYFATNLILLVPKLTGHERALHSTNAMIAVWTLTLGPLVRSCIRTIDCTRQTQYSPVIYTLDGEPLASDLLCLTEQWLSLFTFHLTPSSLTS